MGLAARKLRMTAPAAGSSFVPTDISGCIQWLDASDTATISDTGGLVDTWADKSASGNDATGVTTERPATGATTQDGLNVIDYSATQQRLTLAASIPYSRTVPLTLFIVANKANVANKQVLLNGTSQVELGSTPVWSYGPPYAYAPAYTAGSWACFTGQTVAEDPHAAIFMKFATNGTFGTTSSFFGATAKGFDSIGYSSNNAYAFQGSVAEIIAYDSELSSGDITTVEDYLATKWGL